MGRSGDPRRKHCGFFLRMCFVGEEQIAVEGCCHGELDAIYSNIRRMQDELQQPIDLLLCCGDFQCTRDGEDLNFLCCPPKYRSLKDFPAYYRGEKKAPVLTIFIGGNHEASNVLRELYYGGWVAPNIFYLGHSGVIRVGTLRIAGISGIYKQHDYRRGHYEKPPCEPNALYSACHVREFEILKLQQVTGKVDIMMSHDWPESIYKYGDSQQLLRCKPHFAADIRSHSLGNPHTMRLLQLLKPSFWFAGHLHVRFAAVYVHPNSAGRATRFLALDKVLPRRHFLQILEVDSTASAGYRPLLKPSFGLQQRCISPFSSSSGPLSSSSASSSLSFSSSSSSSPSSCSSPSSSSFSPPSNAAPSPVSICYDVEWLAILRANQLRIPTSRTAGTYTAVAPTAADLQVIRENFRRYNIRRRTPLSVPPENNSSSDGDAERQMAEAAEAEGAAAAKKEKTSFENEDEYEWPPWDSSAAPFQNLQQQRAFLLCLLGFGKDDDVLWRNGMSTNPTERAVVCWRDGQQPQQQSSSSGQQQQQEEQPFDGKTNITAAMAEHNEEVDICCTFISDDEENL